MDGIYSIHGDWKLNISQIMNNRLLLMSHLLKHCTYRYIMTIYTDDVSKGNTKIIYLNNCDTFLSIILFSWSISRGGNVKLETETWTGHFDRRLKLFCTSAFTAIQLIIRFIKIITKHLKSISILKYI